MYISYGATLEWGLCFWICKVQSCYVSLYNPFFFFSCIKMHFKRRKEKHTHHLRVINYQQGYDICLIIIVYLFWHLCTFNFFILFFFKKKMAIWFTPFYLLVLLAINKTMNLKWNSKEKVWEVRPCWFRII